VMRKRYGVRLGVEGLERRDLMAAGSSLPTAYDVYAMTIINEMRHSPQAFGQDLKNLYLANKNGTNYVAWDGMSSSDPVWTQIREDIDNSEQTSSWRSGFNGGGPNTFLSVLSSLPSTLPLVIGEG